MTSTTNKWIDINSITNDRSVQIPSKTFKGRLSSGTGNLEDISLRDLLLKSNHAYLIAQNDFEAGVLSPWAGTNTGAGTSVTTIAPLDNTHSGLVQLSTGVTATGLAGVRYNATNSMFIAGGGELIGISKIRLPTLSTGAQGYRLKIGFIDSFTTGDNTDSCGYFEYSHDVNGGNWVIATAKNSTRTKVNTIIPPIANQFIYLKTVTNAAGTQTDFYINNVLAGSINTNIPTTVARSFDFGCFIVKWVGNTARTMLVDRCFIARERLDVDNF